MNKTKGEVWIAIGSIGHIVTSSLSILMGILLAIGVGVLGGVLSNLMISGYAEYGDDLRIPGALGGALGVLGTWTGVLIIIFGAVGIYLAVQCLKRKSDLQRTTFPLVVGIIYSVFGLISVISAFNIFALIGLLLSVSLLVGAILNKQQAAVGMGYAPPGYQPTQGYPGQGQYGPGYNQGAYGAPQQTPYQQPGYPNQPPYQQPGYPNQPPSYGQPAGQPSYPQHPSQGGPEQYDVQRQQHQSPPGYEVPSQYDPSHYYPGSNQGPRE
ncbi:MAG: hypothetical protein ACOX36_07600 [Saccharofermentanales bacterium]|jgi:hypothetical protein